MTMIVGGIEKHKIFYRTAWFDRDDSIFSKHLFQNIIEGWNFSLFENVSKNLNKPRGGILMNYHSGKHTICGKKPIVLLIVVLKIHFNRYRGCKITWMYFDIYCISKYKTWCKYPLECVEV